MKRKEFEALVKRHLLAHMAGYLVHGDLLFRRPLDTMLRGFCFEGSGFDKSSFTVNAFVQPIYVPHPFIHFTFGIRPGRLSGVGQSWWTITEESELDVMRDVLRFVQEEGIPFIDTWQSPKDIVEKANPYSTGPDYYPVLEAVMYSAVLVDESAAAYKAFDRLKSVLEGEYIEPDAEWPRETLGRAKLLLNTYRQGHVEALALLNKWRAETLRNLRLTEFAEPPCSGLK